MRLAVTVKDVVPLHGWEGGQLAMSSRVKNKASENCASWYTATDLELLSLRLMLETSLGHCCGHLRES